MKTQYSHFGWKAGGFGVKKRPVGSYCKKSGHVLADCWTLKRRRESSKGVTLVNTSKTETELCNMLSLHKDCPLQDFAPFIMDRSVSLTVSKPVRIP